MKVFEIVTNTDCNLRCDYCFAKNKEKNIMKEETIYNTLSFIKSNIENNEKFILKIYGGESFLYINNVIKFINLAEDYFEEYDFEMPIITNGTIFNKEICEMINKFKNISMAISIDGCKKIQNQHRKFQNGQDSWDIVKKNITKYKENIINKKGHLCKLTLQYVMTQEIIENFKDVNKELSSFGIPYFELLMTDKGCNNINPLLFKKVIKYQFENNINGNKYRLDSIPTNYKFNKNNREYCGAGKSYFCVVPNGDIYPCSLAFHNNLYQYKIGNVKTGLILNDTKQYFLNKITSVKCKTCNNNDLCLGYCIFNNLIERNDFNNLNDKLCTLNKIYTKEYKQKATK